MTFVVRALDHRSFGRLEWCNVRMDDLVAWLRGLFHDFSVRAPFGIGWELDRAEPPLTATVTPADGWTALFRLTGDDVGERLNFADQLRVFLDTELDRPVPPCPNHLAGLVPVRVDDTVEWRCPEGDFRCRVGDYEEALWPPGLQEDPGNVAPMLAARFRRLDVRGIQSVAVELRGRRWVAVVELRPDGDETAVREAAAPVVVAAEPVDAMRTVRLERLATETEPAHRALTIAGTPMRLAMCGGRLGRAVVVGHYDVLVDDVFVRLLPQHRIGPPGGALVLDAAGEPFAYEGDRVCCVGGFGVTGPVRGETRVFNAGELRVYE
jgi:hypothetical protein